MPRSQKLGPAARSALDLHMDAIIHGEPRADPRSGKLRRASRRNYLERVDADKCAHARGDVGFNHKLRSCGLAHAHS